VGKNFIQQIQQLWSRLSPRQRLFVGGGTLATLALVGVMAKMFASPEYKPLMMGLEPEDAQAIGAQLTASKIAFQMTPDGKSINVAADQLDTARMQVASQGSSHSGRMGFELFDKTSWGQTEFDEKVNYQRALEGELERTIQTLNGVRSARVHLVMPTPSIFLDRERAAKASVALRMKHGALTDDQLRGIARLVSGAVDDLAPRDVVIIDADSNQALGEKSGTAEQRELESELSRRLIDTLGPAVGIDNLRASVNVEYDLSTSEENQDTYDPDVSAVLTSQNTTEQAGSGSVAGGVAGTTSNVPNAAGGGQAQDVTGDDGSQTSSSENSTFGVNKTVRHTISPAGRIRRISAAILVNDVQERRNVNGKWVITPHKRTPEQIQQLTELARGVLGSDVQRGDVVTVQNMTFDDTESTDIASGWVEKVRGVLTAYPSLVRYSSMLVLFVLVWALLLRPMQKQVAGWTKELTAGSTNTELLAAESKPERTPAAISVTVGNEAESTVIKRELGELIQAEPAAMSRTLQAWLREENV
jgi:flagellar M-ring protein FliF